MSTSKRRREPLSENVPGEYTAVRALVYAMAAILYLGCVVGIVIAVRDADYLLALLFAGTLAFWLILVYCSMMASRLAPSVETGTAGLTFRQHPRAGRLFGAMTVIGIVTYGAWGVLGFVGAVTFPFDLHDDGDSHWPFLLSFGTFAVFSAVGLVDGARHRFSSYLRLSPDGYSSSAVLNDFRGSWAEVVDVSAKTPTYRPPWSKKTIEMHQSWCPITFTRTDGTRPGVPDARLYTTDVVALRELVRFYWQHPQYRQELTDERSLVRLRT